MAPSELAWQAEDVDEYGCRSTAPWPASGAAGLELRPKLGTGWAQLCELRPGAESRLVADVVFDSLGRRWVRELLPSGREQRHDLPGAVRLRWEKATFESPEPQLALYTNSAFVGRFDVCLLPPPGPGTLQSPPPAHAQLQARIDQLTAELETEKLQKAEIQQEKQKLQQQLDESKRQEETQKVESAQHENKALHQRIDSLMEQLETEKQQAEIVQNLQKQLGELAQQKAEEMKTVEDLQKENETLQQRMALLTQKAQKSEMTRCILQLKEQCDAFLAPQLEIVL
ncbi:unnamed protein product [Effrenium voratum]|uniref:Uncharacterized protein n=1 Tax=Effrenium voratum TaxID=2562239 RepID=A0AA36MJ04_9DINO|nr:unnamed protein product [Effrenium voratum]